MKRRRTSRRPTRSPGRVIPIRLSEFDAALKSYKEAYRIAPKPELLYDIAQCHRNLNQKQAAVDAFKNFIQESTDEVQNTRVRGLIDKLETAIRDENAAKTAPPQGPLTPTKPLLGRLRVTSVPDGATVRFDDDQQARIGTTPAEFGDLAPGTRRVFIAKEGYASVERNVDITAGGSAVVDLQLTPTANEAVAPLTETAPSDRPIYKKWWLWTAVGGVAVVALAVGLGAGLAPGPGAPATPSGLMTNQVLKNENINSMRVGAIGGSVQEGRRARYRRAVGGSDHQRHHIAQRDENRSADSDEDHYVSAEQHDRFLATGILRGRRLR